MIKQKILKLLSFSIFIINLSVQAQVPNGFMYQAYVRSIDGSFYQNKELDVRVSLLRDNLDGVVVYSEIHSSITSKNGIITLVIGEGGFKSKDFSEIDWSSIPLYIQIEIKDEYNSAYEIISTSKIMSVPYSLHSKHSDNGVTNSEQLFYGLKKFNSGIEGNLTGGVVLNSNSPQVAGAIRWNGNDFVGYDGANWISLTAGGGNVTGDSSNWSCGDNFVDERNGEEYRSILIGNQCWMRDNLNYNSGPGSFAGSGDYAPEIAGRYYNWAGAMNIDQTYNENLYTGSITTVQGACPVGWHLPSHDEFSILESQETVNGITLQDGGLSQFDAKLVGDRLENGTFANSGISAIFWTSTQVSNVDAYKRILFDGEAGVGVFIFDKSPGFSVRCIKD